MAIADKNKPQRPATPAPADGTPARPPRKKRRWLTVSAIVIVGFVLLVGLLPTILAHTPLMAYFVRLAAMLEGTITFRSASLGWFSQASVSGITVRDAQAEAVLEADNLTCDRSLLKLVFNSSNIGKLRIEKPRLNVKLTRDGSNLETVLARWLTVPGGSSTGVDLAVEVIDGEAAIADGETQQSWHVSGLQLALDISRQLAWPTRLECAATIDDRGRRGGLTLKAHGKASDQPPADAAAWCGLAGTDGDLSLQTTTLPLAMFQRLAARAMPGLKLEGTLGANIEAQWTGPANVKLNASLNGSDLYIESPTLGRDPLRLQKLQAACKAARQDKQLTVEEARLDCETGSFAASGRVDLGDRGLETLAEALRGRLAPISGTVAYQGDLERLQPWLVAATGGMGLLLAGRLSGKADVQQAGGQIVCKAASDVEQLFVAAPSGQSFQEPRVHCAVQCSYQIADQVLKIDQCELSSAAAAARVGGQVVLRDPGDVQLSGNASYQWDKLSVLLQPYCGNAVRISGAGTGPFAYRGPFSPARGEASAALRFSGADVYGFQIGPGEIRGRLANGVLRIDPLEVTCNQGRLALQPELRMDRQPMELRLSAGTLASQIQLDEAACRSALKYVVPVLASATQSQGRFSIQLDGCRIPVGDLNRAEVVGRLIVHSATMSPGPLVQQLASLTATSPSLVRIQPESVIQFRMTGGRIYHQGLALEFPEVTVRTYGSVGLDDSLKLMVETSVPLAWLPSNAVTDAIRKQKMQIPMGGTLKSPRLDLAELARAKNQVLGNLARGVLQSELGNQLNRLLQPQR